MIQTQPLKTGQVYFKKSNPVAFGNNGVEILQGIVDSAIKMPPKPVPMSVYKKAIKTYESAQMLFTGTERAKIFELLSRTGKKVAETIHNPRLSKKEKFKTLIKIKNLYIKTFGAPKTELEKVRIEAPLASGVRQKQENLLPGFLRNGNYLLKTTTS